MTKAKSKLRAAKQSRTVWFSTAVSVLLSVAVALQEQLPLIKDLLSGWPLVAFSVVVSATVSYLRVRNEGDQQ